MIRLSTGVSFSEDEIDITAVRAQGAGGQNVNKVASAIHLRFSIPDSSLPDTYKARLLALNDQRITRQGVVIIKAQQYRTQDSNREDALARLVALIEEGIKVDKPRTPTRPKRSAREKRMDSKTRRGRTKSLRRRVDP